MFIGNFAVTRFISIHALREEGDGHQALAGLSSNISIHALREEGDVCGVVYSVVSAQFQSTPSARRATLFFAQAVRRPAHFNPRPPRGERQAGGQIPFPT